jgi:heme/copper-type cytochrome/quinol oxidase subunit 4
MAQSSLDSLTKPIEKIYAGLPAIPASWRDVIVSVTPWLALIFGILGVFGSLSAFGISTVLSPLVVLGGGVGTATSLIAVSIIGLVTSILMLIAFPSLLKRKMPGWKYLFWAELLGIVSSIVSFSVTGVVLGLVWLYFLFQIKPAYK